MPKLELSELEAIVFDFDGVLTDNNVYLDQNGNEMVCCSRADGLAFDVLRQTHLKLFILSTETNSVVSRRGEKLKIPVFQGIKDKQTSLEELSQHEGFSLAKTLFVGNDLNDYRAMLACGFSACPSDSHPLILDVAAVQLNKSGGAGVIRELVESTLGIDILQYLG